MQRLEWNVLALPAPKLQDPKHEVPFSMGDIKRIARPLYDAWSRRHQKYGAVYYLGKRRSFEETVELFDKALEALIRPHSKESILSAYPELKDVVELASKLAQPQKDVLEHWKEIFNQTEHAPTLREALTMVGFYMALRIGRGDLPIKEGIDLYHFYTEIGLRKTALVLSIAVMEKLDYGSLDRWKSIVNVVKPLKPHLKKVMLGELEDKGITYFIHSRIKTPYSTYEKMRRKNKDLSQIKDILGIEVLVPTEQWKEAVKAVIIALKKEGFSIQEVENYGPDLRLPFKDVSYVKRERGDGYSSVHITLSGYPVEIKVTPEEHKAFIDEGPLRHTIYKDAILPDQAKNAITSTLLLWKKSLELKLRIDGKEYPIRPDPEEYSYLPVEVLFSPKVLYSMVQNISSDFGHKNIILEMDKETYQALLRVVGTSGLKNTEQITITMELEKKHETQSKIIFQVTRVIGK